MAYNKAREEKKWRLWKEAEEKQLRSLGVNEDDIEKDSVILLEQIRTIDKQRLKQYMGMMPNNIMARVDKALAISVSLKGGQNG